MLKPFFSAKKNGGTLYLSRLQCPGNAVLATYSKSRRWAAARLDAPLNADDETLLRAAENSLDELTSLPQIARAIAEAEEASSRPRRLRSIFMHVCRSCNLACSHCYYLAEKRNSGGYLPFDKIKETAEQAAHAGAQSAVISGGEPLLHPDFERILRFFRALGLKTTVLTNGTLANQTNAALMRECGARVFVSLHGPDDETHGKLAGRGSFDAAVRGIKTLSKILGRDMVGVNCALCDQNAARLAEMPAFAFGLGAGALRFMPLHDQNKIAGSSLSLSADTLKKWAIVAARRTVDERLGEFASWGLTGLPGGVCENVADSICGVGESLTIDSDGAIYPCPLLMEPRFALGTLEGGIIKAFESAAIEEATRLIRSRALDGGACADCALCGICRGGCPALASQSGGSLSGKDPSCEAISGYAKEYFRLAIKAAGKA